MNFTSDFAKLLVVFGGIIVLIGISLLLIGKVPFLGKLPGDISIQRDNVSCFFPLATSIILSIALTLILNIILRILNR